MQLIEAFCSAVYHSLSHTGSTPFTSLLLTTLAMGTAVLSELLVYIAAHAHLYVRVCAYAHMRVTLSCVIYVYLVTGALNSAISTSGTYIICIVEISMVLRNHFKTESQANDARGIGI